MSNIAPGMQKMLHKSYFFYPFFLSDQTRGQKYNSVTKSNQIDSNQRDVEQWNFKINSEDSPT